MGDECDHSGDEFGARGENDNRLCGGVCKAVGSCGEEGHLVVGAFAFAVFEFSLGDGGAEGDVPHGGGVLRVGLAAGELIKERPLGDFAGMIVDRPVGVLPVDRQADLAEKVFEDLFVFAGQFKAQLDELLAGHVLEVARVPRDLGGQFEIVALVRQGRVAGNAVVVLHAAFCGQSVVVPAQRVEDVLAGHPLVAGQDVSLGVGEDVADVQ